MLHLFSESPQRRQGRVPTRVHVRVMCLLLLLLETRPQVAKDGA